MSREKTDYRGDRTGTFFGTGGAATWAGREAPASADRRLHSRGQGPPDSAAAW